MPNFFNEIFNVAKDIMVDNEEYISRTKDKKKISETKLKISKPDLKIENAENKTIKKFFLITNELKLLNANFQMRFIDKSEVLFWI